MSLKPTGLNVVTYNIMTDSSKNHRNSHHKYLPNFRGREIDLKNNLLNVFGKKGGKDAAEYTPDIVGLQEVSKPVFDQMVTVNDVYEGRHAVYRAGMQDDGIAILVNSKKFIILDTKTKYLKSGKAFLHLLVKEKATGNIIRVGNFHPKGGPYGGRDEGDQDTRDVVATLDQAKNSQYDILIGDLNQSRDARNQDLSKGRPASRLDLLKGFKSDNVNRETEIGTGRQLDYIFGRVHNPSALYRTKVTMTPAIPYNQIQASDHNPLGTRISFGETALKPRVVLAGVGAVALAVFAYTKPLLLGALVVFTASIYHAAG